MTRHLARVQQIARRIDALHPPETRRARCVRQLAEAVVARGAVGDLQAEVADHPEFDGEMLLDTLLAARRLACGPPSFLGAAPPATGIAADIAAAISACTDPRKVWL